MILNKLSVSGLDSNVSGYSPIVGCCGTASVVWWSECPATDPEVLGSIPGASRFSERQWAWNGVHSAL
jgi:hypothetical protein